MNPRNSFQLRAKEEEFARDNQAANVLQQSNMSRISVGRHDSKLIIHIEQINDVVYTLLLFQLYLINACVDIRLVAIAAKLS